MIPGQPYVFIYNTTKRGVGSLVFGPLGTWLVHDLVTPAFELISNIYYIVLYIIENSMISSRTRSPILITHRHDLRTQDVQPTALKTYHSIHIYLFIILIYYLIYIYSILFGMVLKNSL